MKILIQDEHGVRKLEEGYASEEELQIFLREHSELIPVDDIELGTPPLLCIGWEVSVASGSEDLLYVDENGLLTVVETKLKKNQDARRAVVGQILEYASYASDWTVKEVEAKAQRFLLSDECPKEYRGLTFQEGLRRFLDKTGSPAVEDFSYPNFLAGIRANLEQGRVRLIIAIDEPPPSLLRTVEFVNRYSEHFEMYLIQLKRFHDIGTDQNIFVPALFGKVRRERREWNWQRYVAELGWSSEDVQRVQTVTARLESVSQPRQPETRFNAGWVTIYCFGKSVFGAQRTRKRGIELFFRLKENPEKSLPEGVNHRQTKDYLYLSGKLDSIGEQQLRRLCEATLRQVGVEPIP
jgi:hypothetical protein